MHWVLGKIDGTINPETYPNKLPNCKLNKECFKLAFLAMVENSRAIPNSYMNKNVPRILYEL